MNNKPAAPPPGRAGNALLFARNFFRHPPHRIARIREALARKAAVTIAIQHQRVAAAAAPAGVPAAGAR